MTNIHRSLVKCCGDMTNTSAKLECIAKKYCRRIEEIVGRDVGNRGISNFVQYDILYTAAERLLHKRFNILIATGYPCLMKYDPPTESDGLAGTLSMSNTLLNLNKAIGITTDAVNSEPVRKSVEYLIKTRRALYPDQRLPDDVALHVFTPECTSPTGSGPDKFSSLLSGYHALIAIERSGRAADGRYYTMRGLDMTHIMAPIDQLFVSALQGPQTRTAVTPASPGVGYTPAQDCFTLGIGDGGNEVGMGNYIDKVHKYIPNGELIGCVVKCHTTLVCGISNWGGYAVSAALAIRAMVALCSAEPAAVRDTVKIGQLSNVVNDIIMLLLPDPDREVDYARYLMSIGVRDGVTGECTETVDGLPMSGVINALISATRECCSELAKSIEQ